MAYSVPKSPPRLCSRDGKLRHSMDALSTIFLLFLCLASYFHHFLLPCPDTFVFVFIRLCSSHLSKYVLIVYILVRVLSFLCYLHPAASRDSFLLRICLLFSCSSFSGGVFVVLSYPAHLIYLYIECWFFRDFGFSPSHCCLWPQEKCISIVNISLGWIRKDTGGTADDVVG